MEGGYYNITKKSRDVSLILSLLQAFLLWTLTWTGFVWSVGQGDGIKSALADSGLNFTLLAKLHIKLIYRVQIVLSYGVAM